MHIFSDLFIILTAFFESICSNNKSISNIRRFAFQILYSFLFSVFFGGLLGILLTTALGSILGMSYANFLNLMIIPIFIFIILFWIIFSNYGNKDYRLSKWFLKLYFLVFLMKPVKKMKQSIIYTLIMTVILFGISSLFLSSVEIDTHKYLGAAGITFIISFIVSLLLYSESQSDKLERCLSQFAIWFIIFLGFVVLNIYQYSIYLSCNPNSDQILNLLISILSFAFTITTIADKTRSLYEEANKKYKIQINKIMYALNEEYNYKEYVKAIVIEKNSFLQGIVIIKKQRKNGYKAMWIKSVLLVVLLVIVVIFILFCQKWLSDSMDILMSKTENLLISISKENMRVAIAVFINILFIVFLCITIKDTVKNFRVSEKKVKIEYINRIIVISIFIIITGLLSLCPEYVIIVTKYVLLPLIILLILGVNKEKK